MVILVEPSLYMVRYYTVIHDTMRILLQRLCWKPKWISWKNISSVITWPGDYQQV